MLFIIISTNKTTPPSSCNNTKLNVLFLKPFNFLDRYRIFVHHRGYTPIIITGIPADKT